ncbi:hypothetical protein H9649_09715 [Sporosarcina sp. Sa2YVA2]|uniref:Uncharacterized protein n=1 Tax=Sporosarcina quadrami TaxID=2762234 RepID=A0ABR8U9Z3_9BACL|nr:hypothetical protein [Sporosarcina quadrami]MBD7984860.1 hypothetical protein [Sporosarcina quadrami]
MDTFTSVAGRFTSAQPMDMSARPAYMGGQHAFTSAAGRFTSAQPMDMSA